MIDFKIFQRFKLHNFVIDILLHYVCVCLSLPELEEGAANLYRR